MAPVERRNRTGERSLTRTIAYLVAAGGLLAVLAMLVHNRERVDVAPLPAVATRAMPQLPAEPAAAPVADAPLPLRTEPNMLTAITRQSLPDIEVPPWADDMEGAILAHIAQHPALELTELQVQCATDQCVIFLGGRSVAVYDMAFDVFATEHGFSDATIYSVDGGPNRIVYLRR